jgi:hypothetical protein
VAHEQQIAQERMRYGAAAFIDSSGGKKNSRDEHDPKTICAETGWTLKLVDGNSSGELEQGLRRYCPDVALLDLSVLQPDAATCLRVLYLTFPSLPIESLPECAGCYAP